MKTTVDIPDSLLRAIKALGARHGFSMREFITQALLDRLERMQRSEIDKPWMEAFGGLGHLEEENERIRDEIEREFGQIEPESWH